MRVSLRLVALLSVLSLVSMPAETSAQQRRRQGPAQERAPQVKVLPIQVIGNFSSPEDAQSATFSPDGKLVALSGYSGLTLWDTASGRPVRSLTQRPYFTANAFSEDELIAAGLGQRAISSGDIGAERGGILLWEADTGKLRTTLRSQRGAITALTFSANDKYIVSGSLGGTIQYWDRNTGKPVATAVAGPNGKWIVLTDAGFYAGSEGSDDAVNVVRSTEWHKAPRSQKSCHAPIWSKPFSRAMPPSSRRRQKSSTCPRSHREASIPPSVPLISAESPPDRTSRAKFTAH